MIKKVIKRDGAVVDFNAAKIYQAIEKAFIEGKQEYSEETLNQIVTKVEDSCAKIAKNDIIGVEEIQNSVEEILKEGNYPYIGQLYSNYRKQREKIRNLKSHSINYEKLISDYININDWRVKENSTVTYSLGGLILSNSGAVTANYWLSNIYDEEIGNAHRNADIHIHDLSMLSGYCAGWSLKQLIKEGLGGVNGKITSSPASHLSTLCNQMVNFLGIMQNEWAGAQAFSSFDTYLAPFVKVDNLSYKEVKQCIQSFVYGVNTPSRWGCVDTDTEVLSTTGWKKYNELKEGDLIYTWKDGELQVNEVRKVIVKPYKGKMHSYIRKEYNQTVTPNHRVLVKKNNDEYEIKLSEEIFDLKNPKALPTMFKGSDAKGIKLSDAEIQLAAILYTDGNIDIRDGKVHKVKIFKSKNRFGIGLIESLLNELDLTYTKEIKKGGFNSEVICYTMYGDSARQAAELIDNNKKSISPTFMEMNFEQANLFIETWSRFDGDYIKMKLQYDNEQIGDQLQQICLLAGYTSYHTSRNKTNYIKCRKFKNVVPSERKEIDYDGYVWCPNVENGTAVFRKDGNVYISGQTQAPFTNITLDWTVPADLAELNCIVGGKEVNFKYKDCKKEMDMINKAFIEIMTEGDANGRGFQYPIPTYSITKDFDWSDTENNRLLFEMTAKYGTPYFSNYINSDMEPSDVRSMCPLTSDTKIMVKSSVGISIQDIKTLADNQAKRNTHYEVWTKDGWKKATFNNQKMTDVYAITLSNGVTVKMGENHLQPTKRGTVSAKELVVGDLIPFNKKEVKVNNLGSRDLGYAIGAYMGDGSRDDNAIIYSLDAKEKDDLTEQELTRIWNTLGYEVKVTKESTKPSVRFVRVNGKPYTIVSQFVLGDNALNKKFSQKVWNMGVEFKKGLIAGYAATDGARDKKRLYTSSPQMREDLMSLFASIGRKALGHYEDNRTNRLGKEINYRIDYPERTSYGTYFSEDEDYNYYSITSIEKVKDSKTKLYCLEVDNDDHLFMLANGMITHNCRLRLDLRELRKKSGGFFGSGESTGSVGVVTINIPRIAYVSKNEEEFYSKLSNMMDIAARSLHIKREVITELLENGLYPYTKRYLGTFNNHFSTIGLVGMNEACLNAKWIGKDLSHKEAQDFTKDVLNFMREKLSDYQELYGDLYNLEATPAESTSYRLAKHDKEQFPNIITSVGLENDTPYYTNSSHLPVNYTASVFEALDIQDELQTLYTSGTVFHAFLGEKLPNWESTANLVRKIAENYKLPYYTMSPTYSVCTEHGYIIGEHYKCPKCGKPTEVYSRITGYYRPVQNWNDGKLAEFKNRKLYENFELTKNKKEDVEKIEDSKKDTTFSGKPLLFTTPTCPNCPIAKSELDYAGIEYEAINANENIDLVEQYGIMQAPTLVVFENGNIQKYVGVGRIKKYLDNI